MEKLKDLWNDNTKRYAIPAGAAALTLLTGAYTYKKLSAANPEFGGVDVEFQNPNIALYHLEAIVRDKLISNVRYELFLVLGKDSLYSGKVSINFNFSASKNPDEQLFIDFHGKKVTDLVINDQIVPNSQLKFTKHRLQIPLTYLKNNGKNQVDIKFIN